jgi:hypothetical protein
MSSIGYVQNDFRAYGTFGTNRGPILRQDLRYVQMGRNELPLEPHQLAVPSRLFKMVSEPMVHLALAVHLSCVKVNTISKRTETRFHLGLVT